MFDKWVKAGASKHRSNTSVTQKFKEIDCEDDLGNLFDLSDKSALETMEYDEDKNFIRAQQEKGRRGYLAFPIDTSVLKYDGTLVRFLQYFNK